MLTHIISCCTWPYRRSWWLSSAVVHETNVSDLCFSIAGEKLDIQLFCGAKSFVWLEKIFTRLALAFIWYESALWCFPLYFFLLIFLFLLQFFLGFLVESFSDVTTLKSFWFWSIALSYRDASKFRYSRCCCMIFILTDQIPFWCLDWISIDSIHIALLKALISIVSWFPRSSRVKIYYWTVNNASIYSWFSSEHHRLIYSSVERSRSSISQLIFNFNDFIFSLLSHCMNFTDRWSHISWRFWWWFTSHWNIYYICRSISLSSRLIEIAQLLFDLVLA